jgi:CheY-like chemotaxis protein
MRLESWGHDITTAHNWLSAMMLMGKHEFDLMIIDVETPTGNGLTACSDLSDNAKIAATPKVFITGRSDVETLQRCRELNADYIHKASRVFDELQKLIDQIKTRSEVETV